MFFVFLVSDVHFRSVYLKRHVPCGGRVFCRCVAMYLSLINGRCSRKSEVEVPELSEANSPSGFTRQAVTVESVDSSSLEPEV